MLRKRKEQRNSTILLYGTTNQAKVDHMNEMLKGLDITIQGLGERSQNPPRVEENGSSPLENARKKALAYYKVYREPLFSCDSGLYFEEVAPEDQPGLFIRRVGGRELSDEEMIDHYSSLASRYGGRLTARYENAITLIVDENRILESQGDDLSSIDFHLSQHPTHLRRPGFPLDSLAVNRVTGDYFLKTQESRRDDTNKILGYRRFFSDYIEYACG